MRSSPPLLRFAISGGVIAALAFSLTAALQLAGLPFQGAFVLAYVISVAMHFLLHRYFTFAGEERYKLTLHHQAMRFFAVALAYYVLIAVSVATLAPALDVHPLLVYAGVSGIAAVVNFTVLLFKVFHHHPSETKTRVESVAEHHP